MSILPKASDLCGIVPALFLHHVLNVLSILSPNSGDGEVERPWNPVRQADTYGSYLLPHYFRLWLYYLAMIRPDKGVNFDEYSLPFSRLSRMQSMLMQIGVHYRLCLYIDKVFPPI